MKELKNYTSTSANPEAETSAQVLRGLISYHERMTMGNYPERDFYLDALRYALSAVEATMEKAQG